MIKCTIAKHGVVVREHFLCPTNAHVKNEKLYGCTKGQDTIGIQLVNMGVVHGYHAIGILGKLEFQVRPCILGNR
jgi:hypothetical protein